MKPSFLGRGRALPPATAAFLWLAACAAESPAPETQTQPLSPASQPTTNLAAATVRAPKRDMRQRPPEVSELWATPDGTGKSLLHIAFAKNEELPDEIVLQPDGERLSLKRDVEDKQRANSFVASLDVKFSDVQAGQKNFITALRKRDVSSALVFSGREIVGKRAVPLTFDDRFIPFPIGGVSALINNDASLMVTNPTVVEDPTRTGTPCGGNTSGVWSFKHLMEEMANQPVTGTDPADLTELWLQNWVANQNINGFNAPARLAMNSVLSAWPRVGGKLDLAQAPFKLLAIVNRIDLAGNPSYGPVSGAEGRFVFELLDQATCTPRSFLAIFEYGIPRTTCSEMRDWAQQWIDLDLNPVGSPAYNAALEAITEQFVARNANPAKPNGSALNQLRSNEIALAAPWELREFRLLPQFPMVPLLRTDTVKLTPDASFDGTAALAGWMTTTGVPPLTAIPPAITVPPNFWNAPGTTSAQRHPFSLSTCNGCHRRETDTIFTHVKTAPIGSAAALSGFLTGITVIDPVDPTISRSFNDLAQRAAKLQAFASSSCRGLIFPNLVAQGALVRPFPPIDVIPHRMPH